MYDEIDIEICDLLSIRNQLCTLYQVFVAERNSTTNDSNIVQILVSNTNINYNVKILVSITEKLFCERVSQSIYKEKKKTLSVEKCLISILVV